MRVLCTGSSGFIGRHLVPRLRDEGDDVFTLHRDGAPRSGTEIASSPDFGDGDPFPEGLDLVVHLAALNPERDREASDAAALRLANAVATGTLARRAAAAGVPRFLYLSTANVHGADPGRAVVEEDEPAPQDDYAASKLEGEEALREAAAGTAMRWTILRPAAVYGSGGRGAVAALERVAATGFPLPFASLGARRSVLALDNLLDAILLAKSHPAARDDVFLVADDDPSSLTELVEMMRAARDRTSRQFPMAPALVELLLRLAGRGETARRMREAFLVDTSKIRLRLGWRPRLSTRDALGVSALASARPARRVAKRAGR